jgi:hypothetical protein
MSLEIFQPIRRGGVSSILSHEIIHRTVGLPSNLSHVIIQPVRRGGLSTTLSHEIIHRRGGFSSPFSQEILQPIRRRGLYSILSNDHSTNQKGRALHLAASFCPTTKRWPPHVTRQCPTDQKNQMS